MSAKIIPVHLTPELADVLLITIQEAIGNTVAEQEYVIAGTDNSKAEASLDAAVSKLGS